ncbi:MAG: type 4a pilus biogenesis protein PilO [Firmicutes bacterium]|nr:type 4a pilus biogenesis protein PilO [Bacillota bacterium]
MSKPGCVVAAVMAIFVSGSFWWLQDASRRLQGELQALQFAYEKVQPYRLDGTRLAREHNQLMGERTKLAQRLPAQPQVSTFCCELETVAQQTGVVLREVKAEKATASDEAGRVPLRVGFSGTFPQCVQWLDGVAKLNRLSRLDEIDLSLELDGEQVRGEAKLIIFMEARHTSQEKSRQ